MSKRYKFLRLKGKTIISDSGEQEWTIGEWYTAEGKLELCKNGFHCSKKMREAFSYVQGEVFATVEVKGKHESDMDKEVWQKMRIVEAYKWTNKQSVELSIYAAELVLENFEKQFPNDTRPRDAIEAAKKVLEHDTKKNRDAARSAAESARSAARSAAWSAESAAWSAESAARSAAWSAESAAWSAAESAAESAARSTAWSAAWSAARDNLLKKIEKKMVSMIKDMERIE